MGSRRAPTPRQFAHADNVIADRVWAAARDRHGRMRTGRDASPGTDVMFIHRERVRGDADTEHDIERTISAPSIDDERSAARTEVAEARRFFDRLFDVAMSQQQVRQQADAEITAQP